MLDIIIIISILLVQLLIILIFRIHPGASHQLCVQV